MSGCLPQMSVWPCLGSQPFWDVTTLNSEMGELGYELRLVNSKAMFDPLDFVF